MDRVVWDDRPLLTEPAAIVAFEGWGDAGSASTMAVGYLLDDFASDRFAVIEGEDYLDFQVRRPLVEIDEEGVRDILWPDTEFYRVSVPGSDRDLVVVTGPEPHNRWRAFTADVIAVLDAIGVQEVVTLGAFIGQVPHTLPVPLIGSAPDPAVVQRHGLFASGYEGPTGIVGVLNHALTTTEIPSVSIWAAVPHYLSNQDYPPGALALLDKAAEILDVRIDTVGLVDHTNEFRRRVDEALEDPELRSYVAELEAGSLAGSDGDDPGERLVQEIERFLREGR